MIANTNNIKTKNITELYELAKECREKIITTVSQNGGHLSSNLGVVELTIALHYVFNPLDNPFIFDVSHQCYTHKLLTFRDDRFHTLRKFGGLSGYTKPDESEYDFFVAGHSSTSISLAVGVAKKYALNNEDKTPIVIIGDGAMSSGIAYEALNELGDKKYPCIIILNDNEMSISKPIGALSKFLSKSMAKPFYQSFRKNVEKILDYLPEGAKYTAKRFEDGFKLITPGMFFEELGLEYIGVVDGHDIESLIDTFNIVKTLKKPCVIHVQTIKGKGYAPSLEDKGKWHGVGAFDIKSGEFLKKPTSKLSATDIFAKHLECLADNDDKIVGITAAMPSGVGLSALIEKYPKRFFDVAIAESHAVAQACAMAKLGLKPFVAIYSTFLQRAYDQLIHDAGILSLPVVFAMDRAGIVGEDGSTHQGLFDIGYLNAIPNFYILAPRDESMLKNIMTYSSSLNTNPVAFRYPRGSFRLDNEFEAIEIKKPCSQMLIKNDSKRLFIGFGDGVGRAYECLKELENMGQKDFASLLDIVFIKPIDEKLLDYAKEYKEWFIFSNNSKMGGVFSILCAYLQENEIYDVKLRCFEYEDMFFEHGDTKSVEKHYRVDALSNADKIIKNYIK